MDVAPLAAGAGVLDGVEAGGSPSDFFPPPPAAGSALRKRATSRDWPRIVRILRIGSSLAAGWVVRRTAGRGGRIRGTLTQAPCQGSSSGPPAWRCSVMRDAALEYFRVHSAGGPS